MVFRNILEGSLGEGAIRLLNRDERVRGCFNDPESTSLPRGEAGDRTFSLATCRR